MKEFVVLPCQITVVCGRSMSMTRTWLSPLAPFHFKVGRAVLITCSDQSIPSNTMTRLTTAPASRFSAVIMGLATLQFTVAASREPPATLLPARLTVTVPPLMVSTRQVSRWARTMTPVAPSAIFCSGNTYSIKPTPASGAFWISSTKATAAVPRSRSCPPSAASSEPSWDSCPQKLSLEPLPKPGKLN